MSNHVGHHRFRLSTVALVTALILGTLAGDAISTPAGAAVTVPHSRVVFRHGVRSALKIAHTGGTAVYTPGELYGGSDSVALCFTCEASSITGTAPPSESLDVGSGVNNLTGDYSYQLSLFSAPGFGSTMSDALTYDAQLAQAQIAASQPAGPLGYGWNSTWSLSETSGSSADTVNEGNGAQDTFNESASFGTSTSCPTGDQTTTNRYTIQSPSSSHQWCALANVQAQFGDVSGSAYNFQEQGGHETYNYSWSGNFSSDQGNAVLGVSETYNESPGTNTGTGPHPLTCPFGANYCDLFTNGNDQRQILEAFNTVGQIFEVIGPNGVTYNLGYDSHGNLVTASSSITGGGTSTWSFVYDTSAPSPDTSDLVQIYDPDSGVGSSPPVSAGATHSNYIAYTNSGADVGMVNEVEDGTGAVTTYSYASGCSTGACVGAGNTQTTTVTYPAQVPCPSCAGVSPVEKDSYASGVETQTSLGNSTGGANSETWQYAWSLGYGAANSTETITYPDSLSGTSPTATTVLDAAGNVVSTTDVLGNVATSAYNDTGANVMPELLWSYPGSSSNGPTNPPSGSEVYTYNSSGYVQTETDPLGNVTKFGYYGSPFAAQVLCYVEPPTVAAGTGSPTPCSPVHGFSNTGTTPPVGSTVYWYDTYGDATSTFVDYRDTATGADPQTTTSSFDLMGDQLWTIPPAGQSGAQNSSNSYATVSTYLPNGLVASVAKPSQGTTNYTYDLALNPVKVQTPYSGVYQMAVFDGDNRPCYQLTNSLQTGLTCTTASQAGSATTTYVPGSTSPATVTDGNGHTTSDYYGDLAYPNSPTEVVDAANSAVQYTAYDDYGFDCESGSVLISIGTSTQCNAVSGDTTTAYNALGDETSITDPSGNATTYAYTNTAFPTLKTSETNALSATTSYTYDADGDLTKITNPDGSLVTTAYDGDGRVCVQADSGSTYSCGGGTSVAGVTTYGYNGANDRTSMVTYTPSTLSTSYTYSTGQLTSTTDSNGKTTAYLYNYAGQVQCMTYPVSTSATCGTLASPATGSATNTIVIHGYDASGRLLTVTDWLGNATTYAYTKTSAPLAVTSITYPTSTGLVSTMTQDNDGSLATLTAGSSISDSWTYDNDQRVATEGVNGSTSAAAVYNANNQLTGATNLATSTNNDTYTIAASGSITSDQSPVGATTSFGYNSGGELCWVANVPSTSSACGSPPSGASSTTNYTYTTNGQRASASSTSPSTGANISAVGSIAQSVSYGDSSLAVNPQNVGDALVLGVSVNGTDTVSSVSGGGATWKFLARETGSLLGNTELWLGTVTSTGSSTITVSYTTSIGSTFVDIADQEFTDGTGSSTMWSEDSSGVLNNNSTSTVTLPTLTATSSGELYVGLAFTDNTVAAGSNPGFTYDSLNSGLYAFNPNISGTVTPTAPMASGYYGSVGVTIEASSSSTISSVGSLQQNTGTGVTTLSFNPQHVGDAIVLSAFINSGQYITSISGGGATWQKLARGNPGSYGFVELWLGTVTTTGSSTITVTFNSNVSGTIIALTGQEYTNGTGASTTWSNDVGAALNASSTTITFPTLTPTRTSGELYIGFTVAGGSTSLGSTSGFTYQHANYGLYIYDPSVTATSTPTASQTPSAEYDSVAALIRAGVPSTSTMNYEWNPYGELCNVSVAVVTSCGSTPSTGTSYSYNGDGLRMTAIANMTVGPSTTSTTTDSTWDYVLGGSIPLNINDAATTGSATTNTSYIYGDLLYGGTAPIEQLVTTSSGTTASFLVSSAQGVQGAYSSSGAVQEMASYSTYGIQTITTGTRITPFGFQGSYGDPTGLIYLINRYYDPSTAQFLSVDPDVVETNQPYTFTQDNPLNATDALGLAAAALMDSGQISVDSEATTLVTLLARGSDSLGVELGSVTMDIIERALERGLDPSISKSYRYTLDRFLADSFEGLGSVINGLNALDYGLNDLSKHDQLYGFFDAVTTLGGIVVGSEKGAEVGAAVCLGPEDGVGDVCAALGAAAGGTLGGMFVHHNYVAVISLLSKWFHF